MKRRFVECAVLLGIVMSVMFLAQTKEVIGHDEANHKPPGHNHNPSVRVDSVTGAPVTTGGVDPRDKHFSGTCGNTADGAQSAWGFRYGGGTFATSPSGPDCDTQNVWSLRVDVEASTGEKHARVEVTPSIYLTHFHKEKDGWQGAATGTVTFSEVNYH